MWMHKSALLGSYSSTHVHMLFDYLSLRGLDASAILGESAPEVGERGLGRYPAAKWRLLLERAASALNDPALGLHLGQSIQPSHLGIVGYLLQASATLGSALQSFQKYELLISNVAHLQIRIDDTSAELFWDRSCAELGPLVNECGVTACMQLARHLTGTPVDIQRICFAHSPLADPAVYEAYFGCPVLFDQPEMCIFLEPQALAQPLLHADARLFDLMDQQVGHLLAALQAQNRLLPQVRAVIVHLAQAGDLDIECAAMNLNQSSRTLHRRLAALGWSFRQLRDDTRRRLAEEYLRDPGLTFSEIAWSLGYSELSSFTRAFRRWTDMTPSLWRESGQAQAN